MNSKLFLEFSKTKIFKWGPKSKLLCTFKAKLILENLDNFLWWRYIRIPWNEPQITIYTLCRSSENNRTKQFFRILIYFSSFSKPRNCSILENGNNRVINKPKLEKHVCGCKYLYAFFKIEICYYFRTKKSFYWTESFPRICFADRN